MKKYFHLILIMLCVCAQLSAQEKTQIHIPHGGNFDKDEIKYPGASIFSKDHKQVQFQHEGADLFCDLAIFYQSENKVKAYGNVSFQQGDSLQMRSGYIEYDGNTKLATAREQVLLMNPDMTLTTEILFFDRESQQAYYNNFGTIRDSVNVLTSKEGRYFTNSKKYQFLSEVTITHPDYILNSTQLDYYTTTKHAYLYGPSTITGKDYKVYCERGYYNTQAENGYFVKNSRIDYNNREIYGDSLYFEKATEFASATNNIKVLDTINKGVIRGHYAEVFKATDSVFITKRAVAINIIEKDSMYIHGDTLMVTGEPEHRILRAFRNSKFYKSDLSGKCDSIHFDQKTGVTQLIKSPILWSGENQMTGDSIHLISNMKEEKLDSLKVLNNAFIVQKDTLSDDGYNQIKGKDLFGKFIDNDLKYVDIIKNTEVIYYMYNDNNELIGIDKTICSAIRMTMETNEIQDITFFTNADGNIFPEKDLPPNARKLGGFIWKGDEQIKNKEDIFDEDDNNIELVKIQGVDNPIDIDTEEAERQNELPLPVNSIPPKNKKGTLPKPGSIDKAKKKDQR